MTRGKTARPARQIDPWEGTTSTGLSQAARDALTEDQRRAHRLVDLYCPNEPQVAMMLGLIDSPPTPKTKRTTLGRIA